MTAGEVLTAKPSKGYRVINVWEHKTSGSHGSAKMACRIRVYQVLIEYMGTKTGADLVFTTAAGGRVTHISTELERLSETFGKKFTVTPTMNRKQLATAVGQSGSEADVRRTAMHMTHSLEMHQSTYQQKGKAEDAVQRYCAITISYPARVSYRGWGGGARPGISPPPRNAVTLGFIYTDTK